MRDLNYQLKDLCRRNRDGSYATQQNRERQLSLMADQLHELGYRAMNARSLKPKHVEALLRRWQGEGLSIGTLKNRMAALRWWAHKIDRRHVVARQRPKRLRQAGQHAPQGARDRVIAPRGAGRDRSPASTSVGRRSPAHFGTSTATVPFQGPTHPPTRSSREMCSVC